MIKTPRGQSWTGVLLSGLLLLTAAFFGLLIGAEMHVLIVLFMLLVLAVPMLYLALYGFEDRAGWLLAGGFCLMYVAQMAHNKGIPIGYAMEFMAFVLMLSSLRQLWRLARQDAALRWLALLFLAYLALLLLSSALGRSQPRAALWQLQYTLKLPLMFALGALAAHTARTAGALRAVLAWSWLFFLPFLLLELAAPGLFLKLFSYTADAHVNPVLGFGRRLRGPFSHAGYMALMCGLLAAGCAVQWLQGRGRRWLLLAAVYTAMVMLTGQRQELLALALVYGVFCTIAGRRHPGWLWLGAALALAVGLLAYLYLDRNPFSELMLQWGGGRESQLSERGVLTQKGLQVAEQYFPLGSGLGTYGSAGAQKFDLSLLVDLGFMRYWWFRQGMFIVDTYWPSIIAEAGYPGAALLLAAFVLLWCVLYRRAARAQGEVRAIALFALAALTLALATSPTSAVVSDPRGVFVFWLLAGCAWRATSEARAAAKAGATVDYRATADGPIRHNPGTDLSFRFRPS